MSRSITTKRAARLMRRVPPASRKASVALSLITGIPGDGAQVTPPTIVGRGEWPDRRSYLSARREKAARRNAEKRGAR